MRIWPIGQRLIRYQTLPLLILTVFVSLILYKDERGLFPSAIKTIPIPLSPKLQICYKSFLNHHSQTFYFDTTKVSDMEKGFMLS